MLRKLRKIIIKKTEKIDDISDKLEIDTSSVFRIENNYRQNMYIKYIAYLREKGADINLFLDELNKEK